MSSRSNDALLLAACATAAGSLIGPALLQTGAIQHLPDPLVNTDQIVTSPIAYPFGVPSAILGLATFATTIGLALAARKSPTASKLLGAVVTANAGIAAYDLALEAVTFRKLSTWSVVTAAATGVMVYAARKEVVVALRIAAHDATVLVNTI